MSGKEALCVLLYGILLCLMPYDFTCERKTTDVDKAYMGGETLKKVRDDVLEGVEKTCYKGL